MSEYEVEDAVEVHISANDYPEEVMKIDFGNEGRNDNDLPNNVFGPKLKCAKDHYSLSRPSSNVTVDQKIIQIFSRRTDHILIERTGLELTARVAKDGSAGLTLLRVFYTTVAFLMTGVMFIFCLQLILFLFLGIAIESGLTSTQLNDLSSGSFTFTLLSIPLFINGLASIMTFCSVFVNDTWNGNKFFNSVGRLGIVRSEWISFIVFFVIPFVTCSISLYFKSDRWWEITAMTWVCSVFAYFVAFVVAIIYFETNACLELIRYSIEHKHTEIQYSLDAEGLLSWDVIKSIILRCQRVKFSPEEERSFIAQEKGEGIVEKDARNYIGPLSRLAMSDIFSCIFNKLEEPQKIQHSDELRQTVPIVTHETWDLAKFFCIGKDRKLVAILNGPSALEPHQVFSSFICSIIGNIIPLFLVSSILYWMTVPIAGIIIVVILMIIWMYTIVVKSVRLYTIYQTVQEDTEDRGITQMYEVRNKFRIGEPNDYLCWILFGMDQIFFYIIPVIGIFITKNYNIAVAFLIIGSISNLRRYMNVWEVLKDVGSMEAVKVNNTSERESWEEQHRMHLIIGKMHGKRNKAWTYFLTFFVFIFCSVFLLAVAVGTSEGDNKPYYMLNDFEYPENPSLPYPTCRMGTLNTRPSHSSSSMIDFIFLSNLAYLDPAATQISLDDWFGTNVSIDNRNETGAFKTQYQETNGKSSVHYKLIEFPESNVQVLAIRGTYTGWDALADAQLWMSSALAQWVRALLPLGEIWNPILKNLISAVALLESNSMEKVSYYKETTAFARETKKKGSNLVITGHSLGGGLAMITGGQSASPAIALSGPNNMLSRNTYDPPLTKEQIDTYMFNIIPDRDPVPTLDDKGQLYQRIQCRAPLYNPVDCHTGIRSLCEAMYTCGSWSRPVFCECHDKFGYPKPKAIGNRTYEEACPPP